MAKEQGWRIGADEAATGHLVVGATGDTAHTLTSEGFDASEDGTGRGTPVVATEFFGDSGFSKWTEREEAIPLTRRDWKSPNTVAVTHTGGTSLREQDTSHSLTKQVGSETTGMLNAAMQHGVVRRLTPVECERLMSWPDGWTAVDGAGTPDGRRYAACGDGVVSNVAEWIGRRIVAIEREG